jgi:hypothetical protein
MTRAKPHAHRWYDISRSEDGRRLQACAEPYCIETRVVAA